MAETEWRAQQSTTFSWDVVEKVREKGEWLEIKFIAMGLDKATAHRIAACKEMERALEQAEEWLEGWASAEPYLSEIRAALAKAQPK